MVVTCAIRAETAGIKLVDDARGLNPHMDFHQIFRICLPQEDLESISFCRVSGNTCCHGNV